MGHDLSDFLQQYPQSANRLVSQDLPSVVQPAEKTVPPGLKLQAHDFFTPEPIRGKLMPTPFSTTSQGTEKKKAPEPISCTASSMTGRRIPSSIIPTASPIPP